MIGEVRRYMMCERRSRIEVVTVVTASADPEEPMEEIDL